MTPKEKAIKFLKEYDKSNIGINKYSMEKAIDIALKEQAKEYDFIIKELKRLK